jgi:PAS domain S-box-containing protein
MWLEGKLPAFRRNPLVGGFVSAGLVVAAIGIKLVLPTFPTLTILFPAVLLSAWIGGARFAIPTLLVCAAVGNYFIGKPLPVQTMSWQTTNIIIFLLVGGLIILVVELLGKAVERYQHERRRLDLVLKAAKAALWEIHPDRPLYWNKNFYDLIGLEPTDQAPPAEQFFELVHPEDREKMREARRLMDQGLMPRKRDEYRLLRPDGKMLWLENHRTTDPSNERFFIGITQDITRRKNAEEKVELVLHELAHRIKNQYSVIIKIARDTYRQAATEKEFNDAFQARMVGLSRSNDLLLRGGGQEVDLKALILSQVESFGNSRRMALNGPPMAVSADAAQYFAMAIHELSTNALKYGAFSVETGRVEVTWAILQDQDSPATFQLSWKERGGPKPNSKSRNGFGTMVLERLMPAAVEGRSESVAESSGLKWILHAPLSRVTRVAATEPSMEEGRKD